MDNLAVSRQDFKKMTVYALVTAGVEGNAMRMGRDTGKYYEPGTINILLLTNMRLWARAIARAIITATEAKTAALEDLDIRSTFSPDLPATGTGTDNVLVVQGQGFPIDNAGGHSKMGELIARAVHSGVTEAIARQNGITRDRSVFARLDERHINLSWVITEGKGSCDGVGRADLPAEVEKLLIDPQYAGFLSSAFAISDARQRGLIFDQIGRTVHRQILPFHEKVQYTQICFQPLVFYFPGIIIPGETRQYSTERRVGGAMSENMENSGGDGLSWREQLQRAFRTPLGMAGVLISTVFFVLSLSGLIGYIAGRINNPYFVIVTIILFPACMVMGLLLIPLAACLGRRKRRKDGLAGWKIDLTNARHLRVIVLVLVLSVVNIEFFTVVAHEGYRFLGSPAFCGLACHRVMEPEYVSYGRSAHAKIDCLQCHAAPGGNGFLQAGFSGLQRLEGMITGRYNRPLVTPVRDMPSAAITCEKCHQPYRYFGSRVKTFVHYSNADQENPERQAIILNVGGRNAATGLAEGIHWHAASEIKIEYQPLDAERTRIGAIRVSGADGELKVYRMPGGGKRKDTLAGNWRTMDCTDCHNRSAHIFDGPLEKINVGLNTRKINPRLPGIREDSLAVLKKEYATRVEAGDRIASDLLRLQEQRNGLEFVNTHRAAIADSGAFLATVYQDNIWPEMKITWETYKDHIGHRYSKDGYGCFRCHDEKHATAAGETLSQDCGLCHAEPQ